MSFIIEEILMKLYKKKLFAERDSEIIKKKFETLQKKQQSDEIKMKLNQKITDQIVSMEANIKSLEEKNKLIENKMENFKKENEELKKQIQTKSDETETVAISKDNTRDIWEAIQRGSLLAVKFYYTDNPNNIITENSSHSTAIHYASECGHLHIIEFLISKGVEFNKIDSKGNTPLMRASLGGHLSVINYLLDKGAQINHKNKNNETAVHWAAGRQYYGGLNIVKFLIEKGANKAGALHFANKSCYLDIIEFLLSIGADINEIDSEGYTPLMRAVKGERLNIVKFLIDKGANKAGSLHSASNSRNLDIIQFLLSKGAGINEIDSEGFTPLMRAVIERDNIYNNLDIVKFFIGKGANKAGSLHAASKSCRLDNVKFLLSIGVGINEIDSEGFTPLMRAVEGNHLDTVKFLIDKGAYKMIKNKFNQTAFDLAKSYQLNKCSEYRHYCPCNTCDSIVKLLS